MTNKSSIIQSPSIDWIEDVCLLTGFMAASYENKIYSVGGTVYIGNSPGLTSSKLSDSYLRIVDFSTPGNRNENSIDITTDNITTAIRLPDNIPRLTGATLLISDGVMHMLPGTHAFFNIADAEGNPLDITTYRTNLTNKAWSLDLNNWEWNVYVSGVEDRPRGAAVAYDDEKQIGWYYGGWDGPDQYLNGSVYVDFNSSRATRALQDLYRLDRGEGTPIKVKTDSSIVGSVKDGELVYIEGVGKAGILVLIGGEYVGLQEGELNLLPMQTVHVYDIATNSWFTQPTTAEMDHYPTGLSGFCSVVASAEDNSSHNIYIYGGLSATESMGSANIFILTLPAFHWVLVYPSANASDLGIRRTYQHRCQKVHEKHMVAYRGYNTNYTCDSDKASGKFQGMTIYDMSLLTWTTKVTLEDQKYLVPQALYDIIGGDASGNATITKPYHQGFQNPKLAQVFSNTTTIAPNDHMRERLGVVYSVFIIFLFITLFLLWKQHRTIPPPLQRFEVAATPSPLKPQELQESTLHELHDPRVVSELPSPSIEPDSPVHELWRRSIPSPSIEPDSPIPESWRRSAG